ncbi:hypothetical protein Pmani_038328 [Petrolisthes manimaculis]|uniref:NADH dehydrogenase [ubiquinone] 1 alpha subcomplex subunit 11 n=1 Tax=Petrolisthes manimaculis TaxID=1843537 RepID=A0AAE1TME4_9EUCA|nr:hypothetical protein Pmani_038328 [Petrolisthes manimaculis]
MGIGYYGDHPDGEQCLQKVIAISKYTALMGITSGTYDVLMYTKPQGYHGALVQYVKSLVPIMVSGATFATITCAATTFRGKDDHFNYMLGGAAAGGIFGVWGPSINTEPGNE